MDKFINKFFDDHKYIKTKLIIIIACWTLAGLV